MELIEHYLSHEDERAAIAHAGSNAHSRNIVTTVACKSSLEPVSHWLC